MQIFTINKDIQITAETVNRRGGFTHVGHLMHKGVDSGVKKVYWVNRTWESYPYQSLLLEFANDNKSVLTESEKEEIKTLAKAWA